MILAASAFLFIPAARTFAEAKPRMAARWERIQYPPLEIPTAPGETCRVSVGLGSGVQKPALRFDVSWSGPTGNVPPDIMKAGRINVRLHLPGGTVHENRDGEGNVGGLGDLPTGVMTWSRTFSFPWGANRLEEAWFELKIDDRTYWLELPYGFARDPAAALPPPEPQAGPPVFAAAMKSSPPEDRIVPWTAIEYDFGAIHSGWRLGAEFFNREDAECHATLYRENKRWELASPKTAAKIVLEGGGVLVADQVAARLPDDMRRTDEYSFPRDVEEGRGWGTLTISVAGKPTSAVVPSSLFRFLHRTAEPAHPQRLRPEKNR